jgi:hypothetical protein
MRFWLTVSRPSSKTGIDIGAGMAIPLAQGLELGIEGVWTKFNSKSIGSGPDAVTSRPAAAQCDGPSVVAVRRLTFLLFHGTNSLRRRVSAAVDEGRLATSVRIV